MEIDNLYREYKLSNGLVVALLRTPAQTIATKLRVNFGSYHETSGEEGLAHFLEHCLCTGGSKKFDPIIADDIRTSFGYSNANTSISRISFIGQMLPEDLETWLDYISDHAFNPRFEFERVNGERERVLREFADKVSNPNFEITNSINGLFYRGHPRGIFGLGKEEVIKNASKKSLRDFHRKGFHPNNMDLILVGNLPENIDALIKNYFGKFQTGENTRVDFPRLQPLEERTILRVSAPDILNISNPNQSPAHIVLNYSGPCDCDEDSTTMNVISHILGGDTCSLLFQNLGLRRGLAYHTTASNSGDYNAGCCGITASVSAHRIDEAITTIFEVLNQMKVQRIDLKTLTRIKKLVRFSAAQCLDSLGGYIDYIEGRLNRGTTTESYFQRYDQVTPERIQEVAQKYLPDRETGKYILLIRDPFHS